MSMNKLSDCAGVARKESHLEVLESLLEQISRISEDIKNTSFGVNSNLFGEISKLTDSCVKESVCSGSVGCFITTARYSLETLREALNILQSLKFQTLVDRPPTTAPIPYVAERERTCGCEKLR